MQTRTKTRPVTAKSDRPAAIIPKRPGKLKQTKAAKILTLLRRSNGATIEELCKATSWQAHSMRGFISGTVKKRMGFEVVSAKASDGKQRYRIIETVEA